MTGRVAVIRGQTAIATVAAAGLECAWLYMLVDVVSQGLALDVSVPALLLVYSASLVWMIALRAMIRSSALRTLLSWVAWPVTTFLFLLATFHGLTGIAHAVQETVFIVLAAGVLWWIGARLGGSRATYASVLIEFQFGLIMLAGALLIGYAVHADLSTAIPTAIVFVALGLLATAVTRTDDEGAPLFFQRGGAWWGMLLVGMALVLLLGLVAGVLFTPELMHLVARGLRGLWRLVESLFGAIAGLFPSSDAGSQPPPPVPEVSLPQEPEPGFSLALPDWFQRPANIAYGVLAGGFVLLAIWRTASQLFQRMRRGRDGEAQMESLRGAFRQDLKRALRRVYAWLSGLLLHGRRRAQPHESSQTASIRRLYADMLRWGAKSGIPRGPSQTPLEYQETLCLALPHHDVDVRSITESYVRARYGAQPPTETELHLLKESRRRLRRRAAHGHDRRNVAEGSRR